MSGASLSPTPVKAHAWPRDPLDWYVEPAWCVDALLDAEKFDGLIWDPAAGLGTIPSQCIRYGYDALATDVAGNRPGSLMPVASLDFLGPGALAVARNEENRIGAIICNPPFKLSVPFALRAVNVVRPAKVAMLQRINFLTSRGRFRALFEPCPPSMVYILTERPSMLPGPMVVAGEIPRNGTEDYAWFVWDRARTGSSSIAWLPPRKRGPIQ